MSSTFPHTPCLPQVPGSPQPAAVGAAQDPGPPQARAIHPPPGLAPLQIEPDQTDDGPMETEVLLSPSALAALPTPLSPSRMSFSPGPGPQRAQRPTQESLVILTRPPGDDDDATLADLFLAGSPLSSPPADHGGVVGGGGLQPGLPGHHQVASTAAHVCSPQSGGSAGPQGLKRPRELEEARMMMP